MDFYSLWFPSQDRQKVLQILEILNWSGATVSRLSYQKLDDGLDIDKEAICQF